MKKLNILEISKKAGVSTATVSRVLNNSEKVTEKTRKKVMSVVKKYDYVPNIFAQGLSSNSMKTIGLLCANTSDIYFGDAVNHLCIELRKHDYNSLLCCTGYETESKNKFLATLLSKAVDAIILVGSDFIDTQNNNYIIETSKKIPIILLNGFIDEPNIYSIMCDDTVIVKKATLGLLEENIRDILFLYRRSSYGSTQKANGFEAAFAEYGLKCSKNVQLLNENIQDIAENYHELKKYRAVITSDDELAVGCLQYAKKHHIKVPSQLSVIGCNNSKLAQCSTPLLTSIDNNLKYCCETAVNILIGVLEGKEMPQKNLISGTVEVRQSSEY